MDTNIIRGDAEIQNFLQSKIDNGGIAAAVVQEALKDTEISAVEWFRGLVEHGCVTGWDGSLIYYADTHDFFDAHYDEIEGLREEWVDQTGQDLHIEGDLKNYLAWFGFEQTAWNIMQEAGGD
jgi:hypothetical protein